MARTLRTGGTLIMSTHYPELLDEFTRSDGIYIMHHGTDIEVENMSRKIKRGDIKKSEAYQSGYLGETAPFYEAYMAVKDYIGHNLKRGAAGV